MKRIELKRADKNQTGKRAKFEAERKRQKETPFLTTMAKLRKGQSLTPEEQTRLDGALRRAKSRS